MVSVAGFEPATSCFQGTRTAKLSYTLIGLRDGNRTRYHLSHNQAALLIAFSQHMASGKGFEPLSHESESCILPLEEPEALIFL